MTPVLRRALMALMVWAALGTMVCRAQLSDKEQLNRALEYFQTEKYHECMLILARLDSTYTLNPRFRAFLGVCYYYDGNYPQAARYLEATLPQLTPFSPQELSVYCWLCAESLFNEGLWHRAVAYYEQATLQRRGADKADALYRLGFCYISMANWPSAYEYMESALSYYRADRSRPNTARIEQLSHMVPALRLKATAVTTQ